MSYATNVGKAIALQTPDRGDYWLRQTAQDLKLQKQAEAKAKADQADKLATIYDIDLKGGYLPAWSKAVRSEYAKFVNQVADLRAQDPNVSYAQLIMLKNDTKARIADLKEQNDAVVSYIGNENLAKDKNWVSAAQTSDDFYEIAKHNNPTYYNVVPETGYVFLNPVKVVAKDIKYPEAKGEKYLTTIPRGGRKYNVYEMVFSDNIEQTISGDLKNDPQYYDYTMWQLSQDPINRKSPNESLQDWYARVGDLTNAEIDRRVALARPKPYEKEEILSEAGDGGDGDKVAPQLYQVTEHMIDPNTGEVYITTKWESTVSTPFAITLNSNGTFYDKSNNQWIPSKIGNKIASFNFRPTQIQIVWTRDPKDPKNPNKGSWKKYAVGSIYKGGTDVNTSTAVSLGELLGEDVPVNEKQKWDKTYTVAVPLENTGVLGLIKRDKKNNLSLFNQKYDELTKAGGSKKQQGTTMTPAQEQGIKNVMESNGISRDEAISALKAAGKL